MYIQQYVVNMMQHQFKATITSNGTSLAEKVFVGSDEESKYMTKYFDIMIDPYVTTVTIADTNSIFRFGYSGKTFIASIFYGLQNSTASSVSQTNQCKFCGKYKPFPNRVVSGSSTLSRNEQVELKDSTPKTKEEGYTGSSDSEYYRCIDCETAEINIPVSAKNMVTRDDGETLTVETKTSIIQYETNDNLVKVHNLGLNGHINVHFEGFCKRTIITLYDSQGSKIGALSYLNQNIYYLPAHGEDDINQYIISWKCSLCRRLHHSHEVSCCGINKNAN